MSIDTAKAPMASDFSEVSVSATQSNGFRVATRVIFPLDADLDVMPLYIDPADNESEASLHPEDVRGRDSVVVRAGARMSLGSYFNAFPASYWRCWTVVRTVRLVVNTSGAGSIVVYKSNARGNRQRVEAARVSGEHHQEVFDLPLETFGDGGFYWFDLVAGEKEMLLESAQYWVPTAGQPHGTATFATTTLNKPDFVVRNLRTMADDANLRDVVDEILIIDQGTKKVADYPGFDEVKEALGDQLVTIDQANLGGSGGFSRGMYEGVTRGKSDYVILLDDDISLETESIIRLVTFADMCKKPTLVGGHMFDLFNRTVLHTFGEVIDPYYWQPALPHPDQTLGHDFGRSGPRKDAIDDAGPRDGGLRATSWMHQRTDVDYNGWWMDLIPVSVIKDIGLSLPVFIKWDDSEYGQRAKDAGYNTVSLPGAAVWHISWIDKDDLVGWQAYFHDRNRYITALLHSPFPRGGDLVSNSQKLDLKHLVSMQYYTMMGRLEAQRDLLAGPDVLPGLLATKLPRIRAAAKDFPDSTLKKEYEDFPKIRAPKPKRPRRQLVENSRTLKMLEGAKAVLRQFRRPRPGHLDNPQTAIAFKDNKWWNTAQWDSALVTNAEGTGIAWYRREPEEMRRMLAESAANQARILTEWPKLRQEYRDALPRLTSFVLWEELFGIEHRPLDGEAPREEH
ncbi:glycosyltransferase [Propionibacterium freudenreichii]|uniref:UDP-galactofuranosyl transferase GlfT2 n=1 Tax=Propionibacterium freudenreichii TaxID=1744 RepID=A0A2C6YFT7_9ACTN|nr:glycosyltransferase [Propionibacterium freudenreichii]MDK9339124.1 glycosyltransferase [Propionibacterium freudenreichii]WBF59763.1 glycosyltransferase [Propionibacterium freudenreichii]WBF63766.1 glycosyltransferase [Propionibacterium freudenreichii]CEH08572.1 Glycosyltransferase, family 2 [Propionibacterium freudenreichii]CUW07980.1 Glycosyltransferase [Propionibacterium freudenreichii subsp. shermanii]